MGAPAAGRSQSGRRGCRRPPRDRAHRAEASESGRCSDTEFAVASPRGTDARWPQPLSPPAWHTQLRSVSETPTAPVQWWLQGSCGPSPTWHTLDPPETRPDSCLSGETGRPPPLPSPTAVPGYTVRRQWPGPGPREGPQGWGRGWVPGPGWDAPGHSDTCVPNRTEAPNADLPAHGAIQHVHRGSGHLPCLGPEHSHHPEREPGPPRGLPPGRAAPHLLPVATDRRTCSGHFA